jgi:hypothetical protein
LVVADVLGFKADGHRHRRGRRRLRRGLLMTADRDLLDSKRREAAANLNG